MLNRKVKKAILTLGMSLAIVSFVSGCDMLKKPQETESESETEKKTEKVTEAPTETEKETEPQKNIAYKSTDGSIQITLPDSTWKVTQDADEMRVFSSGAAMISIVHATNESQMKSNISVAESEDALKESLTKQYSEANAFEVVNFEKKTAGTLNTYEYTVKYNSTSMWAYVITYGIIADQEAYMITGTVTDDNTVLLKAVQESVESFTVLNNSLFATVPGSDTAQTQNQSESETGQSESGQGADAELSTLQDYGTSATLYANDNVNIRVTPSTESNENIMGSLNKGDKVTVVGETAQWFKVNINGNICYVNKAFLVNTPVSTTASTESTEAPQNTVSEETKEAAEMNSYTDYGTSYTYYTTTDVNIRSKPGTDSSQVGSLTGGQAVTVVGETANWYAVSVNGTTCYISKSYVSSEKNDDSSGGSTNNDGNGGSNDDGNGSGSGGNTGGDDLGTISGTVTSASVNGFVISADDGNIYSINTSDASISTAEGISEGLYVSVGVNYSNTLPNGDLYATTVTGY